MTQIDEILKKFDEFLTTPPFQNRPRYMNAIERELINNKLRNGEFIKIPIDPLRETFSLLIIHNFIALDGILEKYGEELYIDRKYITNCFNAFCYIVYFRLYERDNELYVLHVNKKQYVYIVRTSFDIINEMFSDVYNNLKSNIEREFNVEHNSSSFVPLCDNNYGVFFFLIPKLGWKTEDLTRTLILTANSRWETKDVLLNILPRTDYHVKIWYKQKDKNTLIYMSDEEIAGVFDFVITNYFKEHY